MTPREVLPHDSEAERSLLGNCLDSAVVCAHALRSLAPHHFYKPAHVAAFAALNKLASEGRAVDEVTLADELTRDERLEPEPRLLVLDLMEAAGDAFAAPDYVRIIRDKYLLRERLRLAEEEARAIKAGNSWPQVSEIDARRRALIDQPEAEDAFAPLDVHALLRSEPEPPRWLFRPLVPAGRRVWGFGGAESGKSIFAAWLASKLTREDATVVYVSQENPLEEDLRRLRRLRPNPDHLRLFHDAGFDLARPEHARALIAAAEGADLVILDTLSACWSGDENDNAAIAALDRDVLVPLVSATGATVFVLDHIGHPQALVRRQGVNAGRGASSKGQKADAVLEFVARAEHEFRVSVAKMRGAAKSDLVLRIVDTEDGGLDIAPAAMSRDDRAAEIADAMVEAVRSQGPLTTNRLRESIRKLGGKDAQTAAMSLLEAEEPPRLVSAREVVNTGRSKQPAKVWRLAGPQEARRSGGSPEVVPDHQGGAVPGSPAPGALIGAPGLPGPPPLAEGGDEAVRPADDPAPPGAARRGGRGRLRTGRERGPVIGAAFGRTRAERGAKPQVRQSSPESLSGGDGH